MIVLLAPRSSYGARHREPSHAVSRVDPLRIHLPMLDADGPEERASSVPAEDAVPPSAVRTTRRPPAPSAPAAPSTFPVKDGKRYFEIDGQLFELHPVKAPAAPKPRGLAAVSPERRAEISARGGRATAKSAKAVRITSENARAIGRMGGIAKAARVRDLSSAAE